MLKEEFEALIGDTVQENAYKVVDFVYTWHPCISEVDGKGQVVLLYQAFGMPVFFDMLPRAREHKVNSEMRKVLKRRLGDLEKKMVFDFDREFCRENF